MTKITFYKGLQEIGGTVVSVETEEAVCLFDFGFSDSPWSDPKIRDRKETIPCDYVRAGILPAIDGIYEAAVAEKLGLRSYSDNTKPYFFVISHMHIDHMGGLDMLDPEIPVYMSCDSLNLYRGLDRQGELTFRFHKNSIGIPYGECFSVGDLDITVLPVDHDCIGASGFLIRTPDGSICYTGDYRFHGFHPEITEDFGIRCRGAKVLITEGVMASFEDMDMLQVAAPEDMRREESLLSETESICKQAKGIVIVNLYNRNVERVWMLHQVLERSGRRFVLDATAADYVKAFYPEAKLSVYAETLQGRKLPEDVELVDRNMLLKKPMDYVLQLDYKNQCELFDLRSHASDYIHMDGEPLGDYDPSFEKLRQQLQNLGIIYHFSSVGGHAHPYYLRKMIETVRPEIMVPLHSQRPEQVMAEGVRRLLPREGESILL